MPTSSEEYKAEILAGFRQILTAEHQNGRLCMANEVRALIRMGATREQIITYIMQERSALGCECHAQGENA